MWASASGCAPTSQDAWTIHAAGDVLRLAALDGITPTSATPERCGLDGAAWAARLAAATLASATPAPDAMVLANRHLLDQPGTRETLHRDRPHTMAAVADISAVDAADGADALELTVTIAGDCQAFVERGGRWTEVEPGPLLTDAARAAWRAWRAEHPEVADPLNDIAEGYEVVVGHPSAWNSPPIGLFDGVSWPTHHFGTEWTGVVVASDGARLDPDRVAELDRWLARLRDVEGVEHGADFKPHDDVVVLRARPS